MKAKYYDLKRNYGYYDLFVINRGGRKKYNYGDLGKSLIKMNKRFPRFNKYERRDIEDGIYKIENFLKNNMYINLNLTANQLYLKEKKKSINDIFEIKYQNNGTYSIKNIKLEIYLEVSKKQLRDEFNIPAVGDIRQAITSLSNVDDDIKDLMKYRFNTSSDLDGHALGNLLLVGDLKISGSLTKAIKNLSKLLDVKHNIYPISEDNLTLMAETVKGEIIEGEEEITTNRDPKKLLFYKKEPKITGEAIDAVLDADLIVLSVGSLYTSVLPNIIGKEMKKAIEKSNAKIIYVCNAMTQPGETDGFKVSDHVKVLNSYLGKRKVNAVIASNTKIAKEMIEKYHRAEEKDPVIIDHEELKKIGVKVIESDLVRLDDDGTLKHNSILVASLIFSYMMGNDYVIRY